MFRRCADHYDGVCKYKLYLHTPSCTVQDVKRGYSRLHVGQCVGGRESKCSYMESLACEMKYVETSYIH